MDGKGEGRGKVIISEGIYLLEVLIKLNDPNNKTVNKQCRTGGRGGGKRVS